MNEYVVHVVWAAEGSLLSYLCHPSLKIEHASTISAMLSSRRLCVCACACINTGGGDQAECDLTHSGSSMTSCRLSAPIGLAESSESSSSVAVANGGACCAGA